MPSLQPWTFQSSNLYEVTPQLSVEAALPLIKEGLEVETGGQHIVSSHTSMLPPEMP